MKKEEGITLTSLVIMLIIILILASIATYSGLGTIRYVNFNKAKAELQTIQSNVNKWKEEYSKGNTDILDYGDDLTSIDTSLLPKINDTFSKAGVTDQTIKSHYKYFSKEFLKNILSLDASFSYLVNIIDRNVILVGGVKYNSRTYYTLNDFGILNVEEELPNSISYKLEQGDNADIIISDLKLKDSSSNEADISKVIVEYKKSDDTNWVDVTSKIIKFNDEEDENKIKFKFSVPEEKTKAKSFDVRISTIDKTITMPPSSVVVNFPYVDVTFDTNGGRINTASKLVKIGDEYGELPTPVKDGYIFKGWNGKNMEAEINESNYLTYHYKGRTTHQFKQNGVYYYVRIFGNESQESIDTSWYIKSQKQHISAGTYCLSFYVRSKNSLVNQSIIKRTGDSNGKTGIYHDDTSLKSSSLIATINNSLSFNNDDMWHRLETNISIPEDVEDGVIVVGNDTPNIYGTDSYIDIANIQLEEGSEATEYEPYFITSSTKVVQNQDHTLKAIWKEEVSY